MDPIEQAIYEAMNNRTDTVTALITYSTEVKLSGGKKNNPLIAAGSSVTKRSSNVLVRLNTVDSDGTEYAKTIREKTGDQSFVPQPRKWGSRVRDTAIICHAGEKYLECIVEAKGTTQYFVDGTPIDSSSIPGLPTHDSSDVRVRAINFANIERFTQL